LERLFFYFKEIESFGYNVETIVFLITLILTLINIYSLNKQWNKIIKSGIKSVSFLFFSYLCSAAFSAVVYSFFKASLSLLLNGFCVGVMALLITREMLLSGKISLRDKVIGLCLSPLTILAVGFIPARHELFFVFGLVLVAALGHQIYEVIKNRSMGSMHYGPAVFGVFSSSFWLIYSFLFDLWPLKINNSLFLASWITLLFCFYKFPNKEVVRPK